MVLIVVILTLISPLGWASRSRVPQNNKALASDLVPRSLAKTCQYVIEVSLEFCCDNDVDECDLELEWWTEDEVTKAYNIEQGKSAKELNDTVGSIV